MSLNQTFEASASTKINTSAEDPDKYNACNISGIDLKYLLRQLNVTADFEGDAQPPVSQISLIKALQSALVEVLTQNSELKDHVLTLEQSVVRLETENEAKDQAIVELAAIIDQQMDGALTKGLEDI